MKITAVKTYVLTHKLAHAAGPGNHYYRDREVLIIKLETDEGVSGWGETANFPAIQSLIMDHYTSVLVGRNPVNFRAIWHDLWGRNFGNGMALGGVAIALEDLRGKALGLSVSDIYGGRLRDRVECYCSAMGYLEGVDPEVQYPRDAQVAMERGFKAYKFRIGGRSVRKDAAAMEKVRATVGPDFKLLADGNGCYTMGTAIQMGRELERLGFYWFEEPLPQTCPEYTAYERLTDTLDIAIAGCEGMASRGNCKTAIERRAVDIMQPDPALCGGIGEVLFVAEMARTFGMPCMPHCWAGGLNTAACVHLVSLLPNLSYSLNSEQPMAEIGVDENPFMADLLVKPLEFKDGKMTVPTTPGLGVEVDEAKLKFYAKR